MLQRLIELLQSRAGLLETKKVMAGFDGFADTIVKLLRHRQPLETFATMGDFGRYLVQKDGSSCSLELDTIQVKAGGNMPILAQGLSNMGVQVHGIGALGKPLLHSVFQQLSATCRLHSFTDPGQTLAIEFNDGKVILGDMGKLHQADWQVVKASMGEQVLHNTVSQADLLALVNWSEIDASTSIWQGLLEEVLPATVTGKKPWIFFDLADCSKRSAEAIFSALDLVKRYAAYGNTVLGLNLNETRLLYEVLYPNPGGSNIKELAQAVFKKLRPSLLVVHHASEAFAISEGLVHQAASFHVAEPVISTGAGDNFNAGLCAGLLAGADPQLAILLGNAAAGFYVSHGYSASIPQLITFLLDKQTIYQPNGTIDL